MLFVTIHEGAGFSALDASQELSPNRGHKNRNSVHVTNGLFSPLPYALLEYDKSQDWVPSILGTTENPRWSDHAATCKFDVVRANDLNIHLYLLYLGAEKSFQHVLLGVITLDLFQSTTTMGSQWLHVQDGTGRLRISLDYTPVQERVFEVDGSDFGRLNDSGDVLRVKKKDTQRQYARKSVRSAEPSHMSRAIHHPFIASIAFVLQTPKGTQLFTPFIGGGHLFNHLQRSQRFDVDTSRFYAASIVCALDYLHKNYAVVPLLKPGNVLLDTRGYIVLCGFSLLTPQGRSKHQSERRMPEYPAPELLVGEEADSRTANWWTLGSLIYEMLTGLPPFYDDNREQRRRNVLQQPVHFPKSMEPSTIDLLSKLLERNLERRLGAGGAADIKAHPFFQELDWQKLLSRRYKAIFMPAYIKDTFKHNGIEKLAEHSPPRDHFHGFTYTRSVLAEPGGKDKARNHQELGNDQSLTQHGGEYKLVWDDATRGFYFRGLDTNKMALVHAPLTEGTKIGAGELLPSSTTSNSPGSAQKRAALEIALDHGSNHAISQIVDYGMDLNIGILVNGKQTTPLQWAVQQGSIDLVRLFLNKSTPNLNRVAGTHALGLAIDMRNATVVEELLANGVSCDFTELDRPSPGRVTSSGCEFYDASDPEEFLAPLVRAVRHGEIEFTRLLLAHGADANVGYHDIRWRPEPIIGGGEPVAFSCGRVVQLGMELKQLEIVQLLLSSGADIDLEQPVWDVAGHECGFVSRVVYQRVIHGLRKILG